MTFCPRRSVLYMPASNQRALEKARTIDCDAIIFDLEDAVAPDAKPQARQAACDAVASGDYGYRELVVRVNGVGTAWHDDDLAAVCAARPAAIAVPKVSSPEQVRQLVDTFERLGADPQMNLWAMIETPRAIVDADAICAASERLNVVVLGTNDLLNELRAQSVPSRRPLQYALSAAICAARANDKVVLVQRCARYRRLRAGVRRWTRPGLRWQDAHPPRSGRHRESRVGTQCRRRGTGPRVDRHLRPGVGRGPGSGDIPREDDREPACRDGTTRAGDA